jgi:hypothetical protein
MLAVCAYSKGNPSALPFAFSQGLSLAADINDGVRVKKCNRQKLPEISAGIALRRADYRIVPFLSVWNRLPAFR